MYDVFLAPTLIKKKFWSLSILDRLHVTAVIAVTGKHQHHRNRTAWNLFGVSLKVCISWYSIILNKGCVKSYSEKTLQAHQLARGKNLQSWLPVWVRKCCLMLQADGAAYSVLPDQEWFLAQGRYQYLETSHVLFSLQWWFTAYIKVTK